MPGGLGEDDALVPSADRPRLVRHLLAGSGVVGIPLVDGPPQLLLRRRGEARTLTEAQRAWARSWRTKATTTNTRNDFLPMLLLNLSVGFKVRGVDAVGEQVKLRLWKRMGPE